MSDIDLFYAQLRAHVFSLLIFLVFFFIASRYIANASFHSTKYTQNNDDQDDDDDDVMDSVLARSILAFAAACMMIALVWLPLSVFAYAYMEHTGTQLVFIDDVLISTVYMHAHTLTRMSIHVLLPLVYFFSETMYMDAGIITRLRDAATTWILVAALATFGWWALSVVLGLDAVVYYTVLSSSHDTMWTGGYWMALWHAWTTLIISDWYIVAVASIVAIRALPAGSLVIWGWIKSWPLPPWYKRKTRERLQEIALEESVWKRRYEHVCKLEKSRRMLHKSGFMSDEENERRKRDDVKVMAFLSSGDEGTYSGYAQLKRRRYYKRPVENPLSRRDAMERATLDDWSLPKDDQVEHVHAQLNGVVKQRVHVEAAFHTSPTRRNVVFVVLIVTSLLAWSALIVAIAFTLARNVLDLLEALRTQEQASNWRILSLLSWMISSIMDTLLPEHFLQQWPSPFVLLPPTLQWIVQACVAFYFVCCFILGIYSMDTFKLLLPLNRIRAKRIPGNVAVLAIVAYSAPLLVGLVAGIRAQPHQEHTKHSWTWLLAVSVYRLVMLVAVVSLGLVERGLARFYRL
jgi:hypothetical protein